MFSRKTKTLPSIKRQFSYGSKKESIPANLRLVPWKREVVSAYTGPNTGLTRLEVDAITPLSGEPEIIAGVSNWNNPSEFAYGLSLSLYEEDKSSTSHPSSISAVESSSLVGDPIADVFGVVVRENNAIIAIADGSGWGRKPRLAARCAVHAAISHVTKNIDKLTIKKPTSEILSKILYDSIEVAQQTILRHGGTLTTLSVAVACQMDSHKSAEWGLFTASVGDSPVCVYCPHSQGLFDVTVGGHAKDGGRNVKLTGGALGPAIGILPDLDNFTLSYSPIYSGDIVILMTDGIFDNFAPKVMTVLNEERKGLTSQDNDSDSGLGNSPTLTHFPSLPGTPESQRRGGIVTGSPLVTRSASPCRTHTSASSPHLHTVSYSCHHTPNSSPLFTHRNLLQTGSHRTASENGDSESRNDFEIGDSFQMMDIMECCEPTHEMSQFLKRLQNELLFDHISAQTIASATMNTVVEATESKRQFRTDCLDKGIDIYRKRKTDPEFARELGQFTSKLDHATIVTYTVGLH